MEQTGVIYEEGDDDFSEVEPESGKQSLLLTINSYFQGSQSQTSAFFRKTKGTSSELQFLSRFFEATETEVKKAERTCVKGLCDCYFLRGKLIKLYSKAGNQTYRREVQALTRLRPFLKQQFKFSQDALVVRYDHVTAQSLSQLIFASRVTSYGKEKVIELKPTVLLSRLHSEKFRDLRRFAITICEKLQTVRGKAILFNINLVSLRGSLESPTLADYSAVQLNNCIELGGRQFGEQTGLHLQSQQGEWLTIPQYLAPEVLHSLQHQETTNLFDYPSAVDVFSLGLLMLQVIKAKPLWLPLRVFRRSALQRRGELFVVGRRPCDILQVQQKQLQRELKQAKCSGELKQLLSQMLSREARDRPTPAQVADCLNKMSQ